MTSSLGHKILFAASYIFYRYLFECQHNITFKKQFINPFILHCVTNHRIQNKLVSYYGKNMNLNSQYLLSKALN